MDYYKILNLEQEPFSNSPDPAFFYRSAEHTRCLQQLELAIRLRRGLNVVAGEVGTGKTTLCRELIRGFAADPAVRCHLILDPRAPTARAFLGLVLAALGEDAPPDLEEAALQERLKSAIYRRAVEEGRILALIIDEGQKLPPFGLECLRELLNYETNTHKLLQIVIFAQREFAATAAGQPNFADRINLFHRLGPLDLAGTRSLVRFRLQTAGWAPGRRPLFSAPALLAVHRATGGYPRRIIHLCHRCLLAAIIQNRPRVGWRLVRACARRGTPVDAPKGRAWAQGLLGAGLLAGAALGGALFMGGTPPPASAPPPVAAPLPRPVPAGPTILPPAAPGFWERAAIGPAPSAARASRENPSPLAGSRGSSPGPDEGRPPALIGELQARPGDTLGGLIQTIYGRFTPRHLAAVREANPDLADPDRLEVGTTLRWPALVQSRSAPPVPTWWLVAASSPQLPEALAQLGALATDGLEARLVPHWSPTEGMRIEVVLEDCFYDHATARAQRDRLPDALRGRVAVRPVWPSDRIFYRDPFRSRDG